MIDTFISRIFNQQSQQGLLQEPTSEIVEEERICVECKKNIPFDAIVCPYCGKSYETKDETSTKPEDSSSRCPNCNATIQKEWKACPSCGNKLSLTCPNCNAEIQAGWKACPACGNKL